MHGDLLFFLGLSLLLAHELDAVARHEWLIFPLTAWLPDRSGYLVFVAAHVPLFVLLLWGLAGGLGAAARADLVWWLDLFAVVHVGLHVGFRRHPRNEFSAPFSWLLIGGAGLCGALDLIGRAGLAL